ncbi:MAG TPA: DCC1-like thiol-disulfide oxidoreductase family protein [Pyrinomonadaceae bacterium]|nr:DCC1-like thiol-disulfide oxidoreductase family protein [Pyrinomonadaceae bacterium]
MTTASETATTAEISEGAPVLLYDGVCGFCNRSVQMILDRDRRGTLRFAALQSDFGRSVLARHPELEAVDSVVFVERDARGGERVHVRSEASLRLAAYLGGFWKVFLFARLVPRPFRDYLYDLVARNRYRFFGKSDACMLPPPEVRSRFIE